jgi:soluble lytic murein transglycosylase-like protein
MRLVSENIRRMIEVVADKYSINPDLIEAMVIKESSGNAMAIRYEPAFYRNYIVKLNLPEDEGKKRATSYGLLQIMYQSAIEDGFKSIAEDLLIPNVGLEWGVKHLSKKIAKYGKEDINRAIAAYNAGNVRKMKDGKFVNQYYVDRVNRYLEQIRGA